MNTELVVALVGLVTALVGLISAFVGRRKEHVHRYEYAQIDPAGPSLGPKRHAFGFLSSVSLLFAVAGLGVAAVAIMMVVPEMTGNISKVGIEDAPKNEIKVLKTFTVEPAPRGTVEDKFDQKPNTSVSGDANVGDKAKIVTDADGNATAIQFEGKKKTKK